ncbi:hypothetical protein RB195_022272 [Necator americanus]|uniref:Uncharacterized protein n=1 Tax=Necator americanus TaxID=51031 RepID=A0ABR1EHA5_NECAM
MPLDRSSVLVPATIRANAIVGAGAPTPFTSGRFVNGPPSLELHPRSSGEKRYSLQRKKSMTTEQSEKKEYLFIINNKIKYC